jgi:hypothetical protein
VQDLTVRYERIDFVLPPSVLTRAVQGPVLDANFKGVSGTASETIPNDDHYHAPRRRAVAH